MGRRVGVIVDAGPVAHPGAGETRDRFRGGLPCFDLGERRGAYRRLVEVDAGEDLDCDDRGREPVDYEAERRPPPGVRDELASVLPKILEPVAGKA